MAARGQIFRAYVRHPWPMRIALMIARNRHQGTTQDVGNARQTPNGRRTFRDTGYTILANHVLYARASVLEVLTPKVLSPPAATASNYAKQLSDWLWCQKWIPVLVEGVGVPKALCIPKACPCWGESGGLFPTEKINLKVFFLQAGRQLFSLILSSRLQCRYTEFYPIQTAIEHGMNIELHTVYSSLVWSIYMDC